MKEKEATLEDLTVTMRGTLLKEIDESLCIGSELIVKLYPFGCTVTFADKARQDHFECSPYILNGKDIILEDGSDLSEYTFC